MTATATTMPPVDIWEIKPIPGFDVIKMKEEIQAKNRRETQGMTDEEVREHIRQGAERFDRYCEEARARKAALQAERRGMILMMVMVMMALLATLVMSFLIMVSQTRIPEGTETGGPGNARDSRIANLRKEALMQLLRGPDANALQKSVIGPHSILENLYGQPTGGWDPTLNAGAGGVIDYLHAPAILVTVTRNPTTGFIEAEIPATALFNTAVPSPINPLSLMGTVITIHKDSVVLPPFEKFKNSSMRIVSVNDDGTGNIVMTIVPPTGMPPTDVGNFVTALSTCDLIINGAPFSGTGIGFDHVNYPATGERLVLTDGGNVADGTNPIASIYRPNPLAPAALSVPPGPYTGILSSRVGIPAPATPAEELQEYLHSLRYGFTSANPDYTAADLNTMFLARQDIDKNTGRVTAIIPSFHRPKLVEDFVTAGGTSWEILRKLVLRPLPYDNPNFTGGTPELELQAGWTNALACATIFAEPPLTANAAYDVDNDGDGVAESYWMDIGLTPIAFPGSTTKYKPLVAYLVLDLDGRIDVNAHSFGTPALTGGGRGPAEIFASITQPKTPVRSLAERYNNGGEPSNNLFAPAFANLAVRYYPEYISHGLAPTAVIGSAADVNALFRGSLPDLGYNLFTLSANFNPGDVIPNTNSPALDKLGQRKFTAGVTYSDVLSGNPYLFNPSPVENPVDKSWKSTLGVPDDAFTLTQLVSLLSSRDRDGTKQLPSKLREILFGDANGRYPNTTNASNEHYLRNWLTGITADIPSPPMSIGDDLSIYDRIWRIVQPNGATASDDFWTIYNALPDDIRAGRKVNLNAATVMEVNAPDHKTALKDKAEFARSLFVLMSVLCDDEIKAYVANATPPADFTGVAAADKTQYTYQRIAQWCLNLVDFSDADDAMTPLVIPSNLSVAVTPFTNTAWIGMTDALIDSNTDPTSSNGIVLWGLERPSVLITETLAFHDEYVPSGFTAEGALVELYNASNPTAPDYGREGKVDLAAQTTTGNSNIWRIAVGATALNTTQGAPPAATVSDPYLGSAKKELDVPFQVAETAIDRVVWFTAPPANPIVTNAYQPCVADSDFANFGPGEYLVIGPRLETQLSSIAVVGTIAPYLDNTVVKLDELIDPTNNVRVPKYMVATTDGGSNVDGTTGFSLNDSLGVGRTPFHKPVFLQRLADPTQGYNAVSNPYITVDWSVFDLTRYDSNPDNAHATTNPKGLVSRQWGRKHSKADDGHNVWARQLIDAKSEEDGKGIDNGKTGPPAVVNMVPVLSKWGGTGQLKGGTSDPADATPIEFKDATCTLGFLNSYDGMPNNSSGVQEPEGDATLLYHGRPPEPFSYLHWNDAPFASSLEAMQVPASSPGRFGLEFDPKTAGYGVYTNTGKSLGWEDTNNKTAHLLNFFHSGDAGDSLNLGKFFDYVALPSLFAGTVDPVTGTSRYREPGKVNLNTMNEKTYDALVGSRSAMADFPGPTDVSKVQGSRNDQPFRAVDAWNRVADATLLPSAPVVATMLRSDGTADPLFSKVPSASNTQQALESLQRLSELTTTRSNTFAVWVTIGLFEAKGDPANGGAAFTTSPDTTKYPTDDYFFAVHPDGYFLGAERGSSGTEKLERFRNLYIIDRTVPVGFRRGEDYNVKETVIYEKDLQ